jgi:hypothetical protein
MLCRVFGLAIEEVTEGCKKLHPARASQMIPNVLIKENILRSHLTKLHLLKVKHSIYD